MITAHELEQVRRRVERLEAELDDTRRTLDALERRLAAETRGIASKPDTAVANEQRVIKSAPPPLPSALPVKIPMTPRRPERVPEPAPAAPEPAGSVKRAVAEKVAGRRSEPKPRETPLRSWLERVHLWPPSADGEEGAEARLGAWWATRVGTLIAVVGVVFFGVYVSRHTPAWVKFAELLAVAAGVSALGLRLGRRMAAFGEVVFAGGLSLVFFSAYAGHAVPALRVFPALWMSVVAQALAVAGIVMAALRRRSPMIATLATGLGHVTAVVSVRGGLEGCALGAGALLTVVAVSLRRARGWDGPSVAALPGAYAVFASGLYQAWAGGVTRLGPATWFYLVGVAVLFFLRDRNGDRHGTKRATAEELWFQGANSTLALGCGLWAALGWARAELEWFYGGAAALFALGAWMRMRRNGRDDVVAAVLLAKAAGALTLAVIEVAGARDAAIALLVQAWVLAWTARRIGSRVLAVATGVVALAASWFFMRHGLGAAPIWSAAAAKTVAFALGLVLLVGEGRRWLLSGASARRVAEVCGATIASGGLLVAVSRWTPAHWEPALALGLAGLFGAVAWWRKGRATAWTAVVLAAAAQLWWWWAAVGATAPDNLGWNALVMAGAMAATGLLARSKAVSGGAWALAVTGSVLTFFALWPEERAGLVATVVALVFGVATAFAPGRRLAWVATLALGLGVTCWLGRGLVGDAASLGAAALLAWALPVWLRSWPRADVERRAEALPETMERVQVLAATVLGLRALAVWLHGAELGFGFAVAAVAVFTLALRPGVRPALAASWIFWSVCALWAALGHGGAAWWISAGLLAWVPALGWVRAPARWKTECTGWRSHAVPVQATLATLLAWLVALEAFAGAARVFVLAGAAGVAAMVARPGRVDAAKAAAGALTACLGWSAMMLIANGGAEGWGAGLGSVLTASLVAAVLPLWLGARRGEASGVARYMGGGLALTLAFYAFAAQRGGLAPYATAGWGLVSICFFMTGLFRRTAPYRVLGLVGLALCLPRMFIVDLDSALHRIVAFIVVGVVLMWVGFSYHRFKHLVSDREPRPETSPKT
jgi:hypothetical protein